MDMMILGFGRVVLEVVDYLLGVNLAAVSSPILPGKQRSISGLQHGEAGDWVSNVYLHGVRGTWYRSSLQKPISFWYEGRKSLIVGKG